jgi:hypothetical protein
MSTIDFASEIARIVWVWYTASSSLAGSAMRGAGALGATLGAIGRGGAAAAGLVGGAAAAGLGAGAAGGAGLLGDGVR